MTKLVEAHVTNIRSSGFDTPAQLREHLDELEDEQNERRSDSLNIDLQDQIARLRTEVRELRKLMLQTRTVCRSSWKRRSTIAFGSISQDRW